MTSRSLHFVISADNKGLITATGSSVAELEKLNKAADKMSEKLAKADGGARAMAVLESSVQKLGGTSALTANQISLVKERLEQLSAKGAAIPAQFQKLKAEMDAAAASGKALGVAQGELGKGAQSLASGLGPLGSALGALGPYGLAAAAGLGAVAAAGGALGAVLAEAVSKAVAFGAKFQDMADNTAVSAKSLQLIAGSAGIGADGMEAFTTGIRKLNKELLAADAGPKFAQLGLSVKELIAMKPEDRFQAVAMAVRGLGDDVQRTAAENELFGKSFPNKTLEDFANIKEKMARSESLGLGIDDKSTAQLKALSDEAGVLGTAWSQLMVNLGAGIATAPGVMEGLKGITDGVGQLARFVLDNQAFIQLWAKAVVLAVQSVIGSIKDLASAASKLPGAGGMAAIGQGIIGALDKDLGRAEPQWSIDARKALEARRAREGSGLTQNIGGNKPTPTWNGDLAGAQAYAKKIEELGEKLSGVSQNGKSLKETEDALRKIGGASAVAYPQVMSVGKSLLEAQQAGQKLGAEEEKLVARYLEMANAGNAFEDEAKRVQAVMKLLGPSANDLAKGYQNISEAVDLATKGMGKSALSPEQLAKVRGEIQALRQQNPEAFNQANEASGGKLSNLLINKTESGPQVMAFKKVTEATIDWSKALGDVANMFQVLGITSGSTLGKIAGMLPVLGSQFQALGKLGESGGLFSTGSGDTFKAGAFSTKAGGGMSTLGGKLAVGSAVGGVLGAGAGMFKEGSTARGALAGAAMGVQIGSIAGPWGMAAGAVIGGIIGAFKKPSWAKVGKDAGKVLGVEVSKELAQQIETTAKSLKISNKNAALLNISGAMDGKDPRQFGKQVEDLLAGIANKSIPAKEGLEELAKDFGAISDAALKAGSVGDKAMVGIIKRSRELGVESPEIKQFVQGQLAGAGTGVGGMVSGLKLGTQQDAEAQGTIFATTFWATVEEVGITGASDAFKDTFAKLSANLTAGGFDISGILGPIQSLMDLSGNEMFRGAADGAAGLKAALEGVANAGYLTTDSFAAFEQQAGAAFNQAVAGGASSAQAFQTIAPLLQSLVSASDNYGINLDAATQSLVDQAKAAGIAFKTDSTDRLTASIDALTVALGGVPPKVDAIGQSMRNLPDNVLPFPGGGYPSPTDGIPSLASGAIINPRPGGTIVRVAEAGQAEAVTPVGGGPSVSVSIGEMHLTVPPGTSPEEFAARFYAALRSGALQLPAA